MKMEISMVCVLVLALVLVEIAVFLTARKRIFRAGLAEGAENGKGYWYGRGVQDGKEDEWGKKRAACQNCINGITAPSLNGKTEVKCVLEVTCKDFKRKIDEEQR